MSRRSPSFAAEMGEIGVHPIHLGAPSVRPQIVGTSPALGKRFCQPMRRAPGARDVLAKNLRRYPRAVGFLALLSAFGLQYSLPTSHIAANTEHADNHAASSRRPKASEKII
jgi:hypothetical protein